VKSETKDYREAVRDYDRALELYNRIPELSVGLYQIHKGKLFCLRELNDEAGFASELQTVLALTEAYRRTIREDQSRQAFFANERSVFGACHRVYPCRKPSHAHLVLRSFIFEPFRIPSDSMMPTLLDGDFIIVNKYAYGLRLPVINRKVIPVGEPQRGDVVVFRYPRDPSVNYIKRLVGLPGDHVEVRSDRITINGKPVPFKIISPYNDGCYINMQLAEEHIGNHVHQSMLCPVPLFPSPVTPAGCNRSESRGYYCGGDDNAGGGSPTMDAMVGEGPAFETTVPPGSYFMMGDNRDNSDDSRYWGFVPDDHIRGRAFFIWFNWDDISSFAFKRVGSGIR